MSTRSDRGKVGEQHVCEYLMDNGWTVAARNYRIRGGEIDLIAEKDGVLAFVEVKTRKFGALTGGDEAMTPKKCRLLIRAAERYMEENPSDAETIRFDTAFVTVTTEDIPRVLGMEYIEDAFDAFAIPD